MGLSRIALVLVALQIGLATAAQAQHPQVRHGFWIGFGLGYGDAGTSCTGCGSVDRSGGLSSYLKMGGTLSRKVLLGGEINGVSTSGNFGLLTQGNVRTVLGNLSAAVYYYPAEKSGFFVKGGAGFSVFGQRNGYDETSGRGWGMLAGLGYDMRVGRNISLTPVANFYFGHPDGLSQNVFDIGLGITFH